MSECSIIRLVDDVAGALVFDREWSPAKSNQRQKIETPTFLNIPNLSLEDIEVLMLFQNKK